MAKKVIVPDMAISVVEDENYTQSLQRADGKDVRLYRVTLQKEVFVLAEDGQGAIDQAFGTGNVVEADGDVAKAFRVLVMVRGWGQKKF